MSRGDADDFAQVRAALAGSYLFGCLPPEVLDDLARTVTVRRLGRDEALFAPGDAADELYVVVSGQLKDSVVNLDGDEVVFFIHGSGKTFGEPGYFAVERNRMVHLRALAPSVVAQVKRAQLAPLMETYPVLKDRALERLASNARLQSNLNAALATRPLVVRLVLRLLELAETYPNPAGGYRTPSVSQATLAAMVGVSRENVNRALNGLVADGAIRRDGTSYVIDDEAALRALVSEWSPVLPRDTSPPL